MFHSDWEKTIAEHLASAVMKRGGAIEHLVASHVPNPEQRARVLEIAKGILEPAAEKAVEAVADAVEKAVEPETASEPVPAAPLTASVRKARAAKKADKPAKAHKPAAE